MARIELEGISHTYNPPSVPEAQREYAVSNMDISWPDGSANALLGPSGCGKTTILNIISGLLQPTAGRVLVDGKDVTPMAPRERKIAQVFQFPVVYDSMNVFDNLAFPLRNQKVPEKEIGKKVRETAEILGLEDLLKARITSLNAADKQKISLGRSIVREDTAAVLLDEPLTVIDPKFKGGLRRKLREVQNRLKKTMIYVTHDQHEALTFADDVTIIQDGHLIQQGTPHELHSQPASPFIGYFIGSPGMNLLDCALQDNTLQFSDFHLPVSQELKNKLGSYGFGFKFGIRPEVVDVSTREQDGAVAFTVSVIEYTGAYRVLTCDRESSRIKARVSESISVTEGDRVWVSFPEEKVNLFFNEKRII
ncbi:MAG: ABC transporter ATP-binding protein [Desulfobacteraceae bacterium]|nr:ABC transporter ATP-binding protein [Desulfobacteraceae bacterium]